MNFQWGLVPLQAQPEGSPFGAFVPIILITGIFYFLLIRPQQKKQKVLETMIKAIEKATPIHTPGTRTGYHGLTFGFLVGEIIQRVSGKKFSALVQQEIARPLGLDGLYIGAPKKEIKRAAQLMLGQRIENSVNQLLKGGEDSIAAAESFERDIATFSNVLNGMVKGDRKRNIDRIKDSEALKKNNINIRCAG